MATENLLVEFPPVSTADWEAAIARDLKGADYAKKLIWRSDEGFAVKPYYRAEDVAGIAGLGAAPGDFPFLRGTRAGGGWRIREEIELTDAAEANSAACAAVAAGAEQISFQDISTANPAELEILLANLSEVPVHFKSTGEELILLLKTRLSKRAHQELSTAYDPLGNVDFAAEAVRDAPALFAPFTIDGAQFEEAGATTAEEVGLTLAAGVDYLAAMRERGIDVDRAATAIEFTFAIGANYFFQIAKLRAFRALWARVAETFGGTEEGVKARIHARTSRWSRTIYDPHVNILRGTSEAMSAVLGGADSVSVAPFDDCYARPNEASRRLARNTQILLKNEAYLARVADAGGGSYYLEAITDSIACEGWKKMQEIEAAGGYRRAQTDGLIARVLERSMALRKKAVSSRRRVFTGANQYANATERALDRIDVARTNELPRGAREFEDMRLRTERHVAAGGKVPRVLLAEIGDAKMRAARSNFAANFFACAGFEIVIRRFSNAGEIAAAASDLLVLCSADSEYLSLATDLLAQLKAAGRGTPVIVAGNPASAEELKAAGIADLVHIRSDAIETLTRWQHELGIKD